MSELRTRMIRDMALRGFSPRTHEAYVAAVVKLAKYYHRAPDHLTNEEVQAYLAHLIQERKLAWSTCSQAAHACRFLYHGTLGRSPATFHVPAPKQPQKLPDILSREEVWRLLRACTHPWHRLLLATTYAAGLRVSEVVALKVADLDADRMTIHICRGATGRPARRSVPALSAQGTLRNEVGWTRDSSDCRSRTRIVPSSSRRSCTGTCSRAAIRSGGSKQRSFSRSDTRRRTGASSKRICGASIYPKMPRLASEVSTGRSTRSALRWLGHRGARRTS